MYDKDVYFANLPDDQISEAIIDRVNAYFTYLKTTQTLKLWRRSYKAYYAGAFSGGMINTVGNQNEFKALNVNHYRSVLTTVKSMITQNKIVYDAIASNTDVKSQAQAILSNGLLQYYRKEKQLEQLNDQALETAIIMSEGWVSTGWNVNGGKIYDYHPETQAPISEGDLECKVYLPTQIVRDTNKTKFQDNQWFIVIDFVNKYDLAKEFPAFEQQIKDVESIAYNDNDSPFFNTKFNLDFSDDIPIYTLFHIKTPSCPQGRMVTVLNEDVTLFSGPMPYRELPLDRITTADMLSSNIGYTNAFDLLPIQQAITILDSIAMTNNSHYGVQNIVVARGSNVAASDLQGGLNLIEYTPIANGTPPQALQLLQTSPETYNFRGSLVNDIQLNSGANAVARGDMSALGKSMSGSAMALIQHMAIQYANSLQQSYVRALANQATKIIKVLRDFAKVPRVAMITGIANRPYMKQFTGDDLDQVNRVEVDIGSAMAQTLAGRVDLAEKYIEQGWAKSPQEYTQVLNTGRLDALMEGPQRINLQIRKENEDLLEGRGAVAIVTDDHVAHIPSHASILDSLDARQDVELVKRVTNHIEHHLALLKETDPALLTILKQPILSQPPMGPMDAPAGPEGGPMNMGDMLEPQPEGPQARMPNMPEPPMDLPA